MDLASKNSRKKPFRQQMATLRLPTSQSPCHLSSFSKQVSALDVDFLRAGTKLVHLVLREQEEEEKEQYHRFTARSDHIFHVFFPDR